MLRASARSQTLKSHDRAVTVEDFELHARAAGDMARAKALPLFHPRVRRGRRAGRGERDRRSVQRRSRSPDRSGADADRGNAARGVRVSRASTPCDGRAVHAGAQVQRDRDQSDAGVPERRRPRGSRSSRPCRCLRRTSIRSYGGEDGSGWPFGEDIVYSALLQRLMFGGVRRVNDVEINLDRKVQPACSDVPIATNALLESGTHQITVQYEDAS